MMEQIKEKEILTGEYQYNDFTYKIDEFGNWSIKKAGQIDPVSLYKYYPNSDYSMDALINNYLFLSHPFHLNDSMDSSIELIDAKGFPFNDYRGFYNGFLQINIEESELKKQYEEEVISNFVEMKTIYWYIITRKIGLISMTETPLNTLMWSHYSQETGFMIEIDKESFLRTLRVPDCQTKNLWLSNYAFAPINYTERLEPIPLFKKTNWMNPTIPFMYLTNVKSKCWSYENEWRLICFSQDPNGFNIPFSIVGPFPDETGNIDRKLYYSSKIIKSIVLGLNFFNGNNILEEIESDDSSSKVFRMKSGRDQDFIDHLCCIYPNKIFQSGSYLKDGVIERVAIKMQITKVECGTYKLTPIKKEIFCDSNTPA